MINDSKNPAQIKTQGHTVEIHDRSHMIITGVNDVCGFTEEVIKLKTLMGEMIVKGTGLSVSKIDTETGNVEVNGNIDSLQYSRIKSKSLLASLLK